MKSTLDTSQWWLISHSVVFLTFISKWRARHSFRTSSQTIHSRFNLQRIYHSVDTSTYFSPKITLKKQLPWHYLHQLPWLDPGHQMNSFSQELGQQGQHTTLTRWHRSLLGQQNLPWNSFSIHSPIRSRPSIPVSSKPTRCTTASKLISLILLIFRCISHTTNNLMRWMWVSHSHLKTKALLLRIRLNSHRKQMSKQVPSYSSRLTRIFTHRISQLLPNQYIILVIHKNYSYFNQNFLDFLLNRWSRSDMLCYRQCCNCENGLCCCCKDTIYSCDEWYHESNLRFNCDCWIDYNR